MIFRAQDRVSAVDTLSVVGECCGLDNTTNQLFDECHTVVADMGFDVGHT
jgi:hypothetical protein